MSFREATPCKCLQFYTEIGANSAVVYAISLHSTTLQHVQICFTVLESHCMHAVIFFVPTELLVSTDLLARPVSCILHTLYACTEESTTSRLWQGMGIA